jgi:hypothetical protein
MNDIYEYKARKYKHKYLKLKREYIGGVKARNTIAKIIGVDKTTKIFGPKVTKDKFKLLDSDGKIDHSKDPTKKQVNFKKLLILLRNSITKNIKPLYDKDQILGNINNIIIRKNNIIKFNKNKIIDINKFDTINDIDDVNKIYDEIINRNNEYISPILKCFFNICLKKHKINKNDLLTSFSYCGLIEDSTKQLFKTLIDHEDYNINDIYKNFIKPFVKNIDYYALTKVICDLYDDYDYKYNYTVENKVGIFNLQELFTNFRNKFYSYLDNRILDDKYFFEQLDEIISVIK